MRAFSKGLFTTLTLLSVSNLSAIMIAPRQEDPKSEPPLAIVPPPEKKVETTKGKKPEVNPKEKWGGRAPYRVSPKYGFFASAEALYWRADFQSFYSFKQTTTAKDGNPLVKYQAKHAHSHMDFGFRVGVGYLGARDDWEVGADWTHIRLKSIGNEIVGNGESLTVFVPNALFPFVAQHAKEKVTHMMLNDGNLMVKREFLVTPWISLKPGVGVEYFRLDTDILAPFKQITINGSTPIGSNSALLTFKNDFWGIGPKLDLRMRWLLGWGFSLFGEVGGSLLYGRFATEQSNDLPVDIAYKATSGTRMSVPALNYLIGFEWNRLFWKDWLRFHFHAGWEQHIYFQLMQYDVIGAYDSNNGNFATEGVTAGLRLDF